MLAGELAPQHTRERMGHSHRRSLPALAPFTCLLLTAAAVGAQQYRFESSGDVGTVIARAGGAIVVETAGPQLVGRREIYRPVPPLDLRSRWIVVQDPALGVVFGNPSGVRAEPGSYEGEISLVATEEIRAIEIRALVFDVWNELADHLTFTVLDERGPNESWSLQPQWSDESGPDEHRTSIVWIHRIMLEDETILEADEGLVERAWLAVTDTEFEGLPGRPTPGDG